MKRNIRWVLTGLCALVFAFCLWKIFSVLGEYGAAESIYDAVGEQVFSVSTGGSPSPGESGAPGIGTPSASDQGEEAWAFSLDLAALQAVNRDVVGWIYLPHSEISYPFVQGKDNNEYLRQTYNGNQNASGSIFMDYRCEGNLSGQNTILYGHYMKNGTMFGGLAQFRTKSYWESHRYFYLMTQDGTYRYEVFACGQVAPDAFCYQTSFADAAAFQSFLQNIAEVNDLETGVVPREGDPVLTLSTCAENDRSRRFVVFATRVDIT